MTVRTALKKLLKYPHSAVFDTTPDAQVAFRLRHASELCTWIVADEVMTVSIGSEHFSYDLSQYTVGQLAAALVTDGFEVTGVSPDFLGLGACVLVEGAGSQANNDKLQGFTNDAYPLFGAYAKEIRQARRQVNEAIKQMVIPDSESEWLDLWGTIYNHPRPQGADDATYAPQIPQEAFRPRVNALAIEKAILQLTGKVVRLEEPWNDMFRLSESALSGGDKFYNGDNVGPFLLKPVSAVPIDWSDVLPIIERNKGAGIVVLDPEVRPTYYWEAKAVGAAYMTMTAIFAQLIKSVTEGRLSYMRLSDERYIRNWTTSTSIVVGSYCNGASPVSASTAIYAFSGPTWLYAEVWGPFAWEAI